MEGLFVKLTRPRASFLRCFSSSTLRGVSAASISRPIITHGPTKSTTTRGFKTGLAENLPQESIDSPAFGFAFDIDGVLLHEKNPIPGATEALRLLDRYRIPYIMLTNGGGKRESERVADLNEKLRIKITTESFVQSHTPFQELLEGPNSLRDKTILVTGSDYEKCRDIILHYGFRNVLTPADIFAAQPSVFPFQAVNKAEEKGLVSLPKPIFVKTPTEPNSTELAKHLKIDAMFVLNDPRDWALDIQIFADLLLSHQGYMGTYSPRNGNRSVANCGWQQDGQPKLYFSNSDLLWSASYHLPRFGQGAFQYALAGIWNRITDGHELQRSCIGKPFAETYRFAERKLNAHWKKNRRITKNNAATELKSVYMIGDNPESDIAGANGYQSENGTEWVGVLVETGVWNKDMSVAFTKETEPKRIEKDVKSAILWALRREGISVRG
ncbi:HAD-superfamily hydrolase [Podospora fimiseda]|uniref:HAD-superfamily hydrolase n=1 Tax=Podospora fimiseda TaxID=252190 RepID=A0AAN7H8M1_9PEZI|nr:HAD-superfamily hydrolase [Podospora fimiseda]